MQEQRSSKTPPSGPAAAPLHSDPVRMARKAGEAAARSPKVLAKFCAKQTRNAALLLKDPLNVQEPFREVGRQLLTHPERVLREEWKLLRSSAALWEYAGRRLAGQRPVPVAVPAEGDNRFRNPAWSENLWFDFLKQSYLLWSGAVQNLVRETEGLDEKSARKANFYARQFVDAFSPANFPGLNPDVIRKSIETSGENLLDGWRNWLDDVERGKGDLSIRMTDTNTYRVGENIALTPGKVVFQNELMQLIQYQPATETVFVRPLLVVPAWINKYYILDLQPKNSFIKWAVEQGHTVFAISWVNPDEKLAKKGFEDYMNEGPLAALDAIQAATGAEKIDIAAYCLGGTLVSATLAYLAAGPDGRKDERVASATFFATMTDFSEPGDLSVFIDEKQISALEKMMNERGYLDGKEMSTAFNLLRDNDLIWSLLVSNYLLGRDPLSMDLLAWNADATRMPARMHGFYLRNMYLENRLCKPGGITLNGVAIDLRKIEVPVYLLSAKDDHIAPWKSTFAATRLYSGPKRFVLGASGHIAGVVNHPASNRYCHWINEKLVEDADSWFAGAAQQPGSWWTDWQKWVEAHAGPKVAARIPGDGKLKPIEDAPGSYVRVRLE
ncbi:MAG: class I poly(R)-hydroxyalkanoic acid synthase [Oligoflexia bacterium]|nr:class I poly(R)-hydroxyalkanoic acid synthase [Oligoflexia bacterium]